MNSFGIDSKFIYGNTCLNENPVLGDTQEIKQAKVQNSIRVRVSSYGGVSVVVPGRAIRVASLAHTSVVKRKTSAVSWPSLILDLRDKLGVKQKELAMMLGVSEDTINKLERGVTAEPSVKTKERLNKLIEIIEFVWDKSKHKKFLFRSSFSTELSALEDLSPKEFLIQNAATDELCWNDLSGVLRRMYE